MYDQNWQQLRHVENERLAFTAIYGAAIGGVLSFLATWEDSGSLAVSVSLTAFLLLFTVLGLLVSLRLGSGARHHRKKLVQTLEHLGLPQWEETGAPGTKQPDWEEIGAPGTKRRDWTRRFRLGVVFPAFYCLPFFTVLSVLIAVVL